MHNTAAYLHSISFYLRSSFSLSGRLYATAIATLARDLTKNGDNLSCSLDMEPDLSGWSLVIVFP